MVPDVFYIGGFYINSLLTSLPLSRFLPVNLYKGINIFMCLVEIVIFSRRKSTDKFESFITSIFDISNLNRDSSIRRKYSNIRSKP